MIFAALAAAATIWTLQSQRKQIDEQRTFIGEQRAFIAEQSTNLALERTELRATADERKIAQAEQVVMTIKTVVTNGASADEHGEPTPNAFEVEVTNESHMPIHEVTVMFGHWPATRATPLALVRLHGYDSREITGPELLTPVPVIGVGKIFHFVSDPATHFVATDRPALVFRDNARVKWRLDEHGGLREIDPPVA